MALINRLEEAMAQSGLSFDGLNFLDGDPRLQTSQFAARMIAQSNEQIITNHIAQKNSLFQNVLGLSFCPFTQVTGVSWEDMFRAATFMDKETSYPMKVVTSWFHLFLPSDVYERIGTWCKVAKADRPFDYRFYRNGKQLVKIGGELYRYGEAGVIIDPLEYKNDDYALRIIYPTACFDSRLLPLLKRQKGHERVLRLLHLLYVLASHDGLLHATFLEFVDEIRSKIKADPAIEPLTKLWLCFDFYEINFVRLQKHLFGIALDANPQLRKEIRDTINEILNTISGWNKLIYEYVYFIVGERLNRIGMPFPSGETFLRIPKSPLSRKYSTISMSKDMRFLINAFPEKEALIYSNGLENNPEGMTFEFFTKSIYKFYGI